jgi:hypothetical protein
VRPAPTMSTSTPTSRTSRTRTTTRPSPRPDRVGAPLVARRVLLAVSSIPPVLVPSTWSRVRNSTVWPAESVVVADRKPAGVCCGGSWHSTSPARSRSSAASRSATRNASCTRPGRSSGSPSWRQTPTPCSSRSLANAGDDPGGHLEVSAGGQPVLLKWLNPVGSPDA